MTKADHGIFSQFEPFTGDFPLDRAFDFIGARCKLHFSREIRSSSELYIKATVPHLSDEYFEWISLLQAAKRASGSFTVVELGAGFGRWSARAVLAAKQCGITDIKAILVEAEPCHAEWCKEHMIDNAISNFEVIEAAVGAQKGEMLFVVREPNKDFAPSDWYGQAANWTAENYHVATEETYYGHPVIDNGTGWGSIKVPVLPLDEILSATKSVDLIDMDIQGAEAEVVESSMAVLNAKVKAIHIGTHSTEIEGRVRSSFESHGWRRIWDYPLQQRVDTPFGPVSFDDGVQTWENPHFLP